MTTTRLCAALASALLCNLAHADNKLFPADLLAPRQADALVSLDGLRSSGDVRDNNLGVNGTAHRYDTELSAGARYGITNALTLGAGLTGGTDHTATQLANGLRRDTHAEGLLSTSLFARYALAFEGRNNPYTLTTDVDVSHYTNPHATTSYNVYSFSGTVSARTTDIVRTYATAGVNVPSKGYANRQLTIAGGGWMLMQPGMTGTLEIGATHSMASSAVSSSNTTAATGSVIWDVAPGTSVRALLTVARTTAATTADGSLSIRPSQAQRLGVTLYHLY